MCIVCDFSEIPNGHIEVGKIQFDPKNVLGHGCEGTFVYKWVNIIIIWFVKFIA